MFVSTNWLHIYFYFKTILLEVEWFKLFVSYVNAGLLTLIFNF